MKAINGDKLKKALDFLFPINVTCNACGRENFNGEYFCEQCENELPKNNRAICNHCGRKVLNASEYCQSCNGRETHFEKARSVFCYEQPINRLISQFKYGGKRYLATVFSRYMAMLYFENYYNCDFAIAVPMSKERLKMREYNQAELLAKAVCEIVNIPYRGDIVVKRKETKRQAELDAKERSENLKGSFKIADKAAIDNKRILLIDDIMTTGATVECIARLLKEQGAESVLILTIASVSKEMFFVKRKKS